MEAGVAEGGAEALGSAGQRHHRSQVLSRHLSGAMQTLGSIKSSLPLIADQLQG